MTTETTAPSSGRFTFLILLLILAGVIALIVIDGNSKRAMAPSLFLEKNYPPMTYADDDVVLVQMGAVSIVARVVASENARMQGLSGTEQLLPHEGLFFAFPHSNSQGIWMKDMKYPLDIIWLDDTFRIVHIAAMVAPETYPEVFMSPEPARYVLEVSAGIVEQGGVHIGDRVVITDNPTSFDLFDAEQEANDSVKRVEDASTEGMEEGDHE